MSEQYTYAGARIRALEVSLFSDSTIDQLIACQSYDQALQMLRENRDLMDKLAAFLIERETITGKEFMKIFHEVFGIAEE